MVVWNSGLKFTEEWERLDSRKKWAGRGEQGVGAGMLSCHPSYQLILCLSYNLGLEECLACISTSLDMPFMQTLPGQSLERQLIFRIQESTICFFLRVLDSLGKCSNYLFPSDKSP